jgi:hypothetical protein
MSANIGSPSKLNKNILQKLKEAERIRMKFKKVRTKQKRHQ